MSFNEWPIKIVEELVEERILEKPIDGNHGGIHPSGDDFVKEGIPFIMASDIRNGAIDYLNCKYIKKEQAEKLQKGFSINGDVLLTHKATIGRTTIVQNTPTDYIVLTPQVTYYRVKDYSKLNNKFLKYYFDSSKFQELINSWASGGSTRAYIGITEQRRLPIPIPPINIQNKIASIFSSIDDKIENNLASNQTLEEIARTIFKEWFVNFNYPNADGNLKHSEFGEIPESWSINGIGEICYVQNGYAFKSKDFLEQGEVGIIKIKNISRNVVDIQNTDFVDASVVSSLDKKFKIESGSLLIAMTGAEVGKIGLVPLTEKNLWLNQRVGLFQEKIAYGNFFIYLLLSTETYQTTIQNSALGSAQPNISASAIESIRAIIPPAELIGAFGKIIKPMFEKILDNLAENETLKTIRDSLLPKLISGEIEVNG